MAKKVKVSDKVHVADDDDTTLQDAEAAGVLESGVVVIGDVHLVGNLPLLRHGVRARPR